MPQVSVKENIVDAAEDVFRRKGFSATSIQDLTDAAGVPKGSFYNHFSGKVNLASVIVERYVGAADTTDLLAADGSALDRLRAHLVRQFERTTRSGVDFGCLLGTMSGEVAVAGEPLRSAINASYDGWTGAIANVVREGQAAGEITAARTADALAAFLIDSFEGATLRAKVAGSSDGVAERIDIALDALAA